MPSSGPGKKQPSGDLLQLLTLLNQELLIELGKPLPRPECLPRLPAARCPASHNRALLDRLGEEKIKRR